MYKLNRPAGVVLAGLNEREKMNEKLPYRIAGLFILLVEYLVIKWIGNQQGIVDIITLIGAIIIVVGVTLFAVVLIFM